jgi:NADH-quinone oxidoreductase subunit K
MLLTQITINIFLFLIGFIGVTLNYNNILLTLMGIELMLLSTSLNFIMFSLYLNDPYGQIFSIFILTVAASESAIGLAILIVSYKLRGTIEITETSDNR